jgi:quercetin 2,3-dioxygenase
MKNYTLHKSETRGHADHGWLKTNHTFSFANYYDLSRMHFGMLRVLNDDQVEGGMGFGTHPHDDMEIITIPLNGALAHKDSMGNSSVIAAGEIQVMSAGTGIYHSEFNASPTDSVELLQIWIFPNKKDVSPRYDQIKLNPEDSKNKFQQILSPNENDKGVWIHQDAWFHLAEFEKDFETTYKLKKSGNGLYVFMIEGSVDLGDITLKKRDGLGITETNEIKIKSKETGTKVLLMEVPMR